MINNYCLLSRLTFDFFRKIKKVIELRKYDDFTIAEYLRKQGAVIGENNRIMIRKLADEACLIRIGSHCTITSNVKLIVHDGAGWLFTDEMPDLQRFGTIEILDNCFIGIDATILPNIKIGPNSIVGACSVVTKDVPPDTVVAGNPARKICSVNEYRDKILKDWEKQRPSGYLSDLKNGMKYHPKFIEARKRQELAMLMEHLSQILWAEKNSGKGSESSLRIKG